jgi:hypothetical protein
VDLGWGYLKLLSYLFNSVDMILIGLCSADRIGVFDRFTSCIVVHIERLCLSVHSLADRYHRDVLLAERRF